MKPVIICYSNSGTTRKVAKQIQERLSCEIVEIVPKEPYGSYLPAVKRAGSELRKGIVAEYTAPVLDLKDYDTVFIGYPIWYGNAPLFVLDYLKKQDFTGKTVIPFSTSGASNIKGSIRKLQEAVGTAEIRFPYNRGKFSKDDFDKWFTGVSSLISAGK